LKELIRPNGRYWTFEARVTAFEVGEALVVTVVTRPRLSS
jgi:hypothetical protein